MLTDDIGLIIGTILVLSFGIGITLGVPYLINRYAQEADLPVDRARVIRWVRVLGSIVVVVTLMELVLMWSIK
jgi:hypothetical protein